jgi:hypothetical protein
MSLLKDFITMWRWRSVEDVDSVLKKNHVAISCTWRTAERVKRKRREECANKYVAEVPNTAPLKNGFVLYSYSERISERLSTAKNGVNGRY